MLRGEPRQDAPEPHDPEALAKMIDERIAEADRRSARASTIDAIAYRIEGDVWRRINALRMLGYGADALALLCVIEGLAKRTSPVADLHKHWEEQTTHNAWVDAFDALCGGPAVMAAANSIKKEE